MSNVTAKDFENAVSVIAKCYLHDMTDAAKNAWEDDDGLHAEEETFEEYRDNWLKNCMNDEFEILDGLKETVRDEFRALIYKKD